MKLIQGVSIRSDVRYWCGHPVDADVIICDILVRTLWQLGAEVVVVGLELGHVSLEHGGVSDADSVLSSYLQSVSAHSQHLQILSLALCWEKQ